MPNEAAPQTHSGRVWTVLMSWIGRVTAIVGLCVTLGGGATWLVAHHRQHAQRAAQLALAQAQADQGDYQSALATCAALLKSDPLDPMALESQLSSAMLWAENFSVLVPEGQSAAQAAGPALDQIVAVLQSGLARSKGTRAADVLAHLGWAHWLNQHIAEREFGSAAVQDFLAALAADPGNVYANAMLGNWMLQNGGDFSEAVRHFHIAVNTQKALPFVHLLEIGGLTSYDGLGSRRELIVAANSMRLHGEALSPDERSRVFAFCCDVADTERAELVESLSAVPPQDAWLTYLWLEGSPSGTSSIALRELTHNYIQASLLEISGQRPQALRQYRVLQQKLRSQPDISLQADVDAAVVRLARSR